MWLMIFRQLSNPTDLMKVSNCSLAFQKILSEDRVYFLFPKILNLLVLVETEIEDARNERLSMLPFLSKTDVLMFRTICSSWNKTVEKFYERTELSGLFPNLDMENYASKQPNPNEWANPYVFSTLEPVRLKAFISEFVTEKLCVLKNPFLGRLVLFYLDETNGENEAFAKDMVKILAKFGHEIWHVMIYHRQNIDARNYLKLRNWLNYLPNILSLRLRFTIYEHVEDFLLNQTPLPHLIKLTCLDVFNVNINVLAQILRQSEITDLHMDGWTHAQHWNRHLFVDFLRPLKRVYFHGYCEGYEVLLDMIKKCANIQTLLLCTREPVTQFKTLVKVIEGNKCLCDLTLKFKINEVIYLNHARILELRLEELIRLTLFIEGYLCIDFLRSLPNLKTLDLTLSPSEDFRLTERSHLKDQNAIQLFGFEKMMHKSNIWQILDSLKMLRINMTGESPVTCYEYKRSVKANTILHKIFTKQLIREVLIKETFEKIFRNF